MRTRCLLTDLHPEQGLASTLRQHLSEVISSFDFTLDERAEVDAIWVYGYEAHGLERVRELRGRHPRSILLVTSGSRDPDWARRVLDSGADHALEWPCSVVALSSLLSTSREISSSN